MNEIEENFAYLRDVLGIKYLPLNYATVVDNGVESDEVDLVSAPIYDKTVDPFEKIQTLETIEALEELLKDCTQCKLSEKRKTVVFGSGNPKARLMFVGEGPGEQEDLQGLPFVGPAGQLLTKMISAMGITRDDVYIANVVKCRPPFNRNPEPDEIATCSPVLKKQIEFVNPEVIVALGTIAAQTLLSTEERISRLRGKVHSYEGRKLVATFHPSYLLRNPAEKKSAWADLQIVMKELGLPTK